MRAVDLVRRKRDGGELTRGEIEFLLEGYTCGRIPDYQAAALLMAIYFRGMTEREMADLTECMRRSGSELCLQDIPGRKVDKHSTGGVGDKTSLIVAPVLAASGLIVPMISGRGLGHTGGTLDKLESIPGFNVRLGAARFKEVLRTVGAAIIGQSEDVVPADRKLYALRDVTATVGSRPLIAASVMSKKLAEGIDALVLDVKTGNGAFMKQQEEAEQLAEAMIGIGRSFGRRVTALVTDMSQPLGSLVGNALEVVECVDVLNGRGPEDLVALCRELCAHCLLLGDAVPDLDAGRALYARQIASGRALSKFAEMVDAQGGDVAAIEDTSRLPRARHEEEVPAAEDAFVGAIDTEKLGRAMCTLGAGRETMEARIDPAVGMRVCRKVGDPVIAGEPLCILYYNEPSRCAEARQLVAEAFAYARAGVQKPLLIRRIL